MRAAHPRALNAPGALSIICHGPRSPSGSRRKEGDRTGGMGASGVPTADETPTRARSQAKATGLPGRREHELQPKRRAF